LLAVGRHTKHILDAVLPPAGLELWKTLFTSVTKLFSLVMTKCNITTSYLSLMTSEVENVDQKSTFTQIDHQPQLSDAIFISFLAPLTETERSL